MDAKKSRIPIKTAKPCKDQKQWDQEKDLDWKVARAGHAMNLGRQHGALYIYPRCPGRGWVWIPQRLGGRLQVLTVGSTVTRCSTRNAKAGSSTQT
jgi:hypothetical protein